MTTTPNIAHHSVDLDREYWCGGSAAFRWRWSDTVSIIESIIQFLQSIVDVFSG